MQRAKKIVQASIRAKGQRLADFSAREITLLAEDYLAQHREQLRAEAEHVIATSPLFAQWRCRQRCSKRSQKPNTRQRQTAQSRDKSPMTDASPIAVNRTLPRRQPNAAYRQREYLTESEVERLIEAARKRGRNGARDSAAILLAYRHGLRAGELCSLKWSQLDLRHGRLHVNRAKGGIESVHPLHGPELRARAHCKATCRMCSPQRQARRSPQLGSCGMPYITLQQR
jgi:integrase